MIRVLLYVAAQNSITNAVRSNEEMAEDLFNRTFGRSMRAYRLVLSLLECLRFGAPAARERFVDSLRQTAEAVLARQDFGTSEERAAALERMLLRHPEQWIWMHRRWKIKPA